MRPNVSNVEQGVDLEHWKAALNLADDPTDDETAKRLWAACRTATVKQCVCMYKTVSQKIADLEQVHSCIKIRLGIAYFKYLSKIVGSHSLN